MRRCKAGAAGRGLYSRFRNRPSAATMKRLLLIAIRLYQLCLSPFVGGQCRFYPSCSAYASEAIDTHGALRGSWLALRRLLRCHPWHPGGVDPVPPRAVKK
ncbi:MAG: membrane protein insertion efficiency factor YidD [Betaproteobacteria bacterium]|nr:membrane protein insertion efficiency factor YidD [Betaproteobacteria bacterium]